MKSYDMELIAMGPVFIGSGEKLQKKAVICTLGR